MTPIAPLSQDIRRVALSLHRKSFIVAKKFSEESKKRLESIDNSTLPTYMKKVLLNLDHALHEAPTEKTAEDMLMYSQILQNFALSNTSYSR